MIPFSYITSSLRTAVIALLFAASIARAHATDDVTTQVGENIYRQGVLGSGKQLEAVREDGLRTRGAEAACVNCHQRSGLGSKEGRITIPPITGRYLFYPRVPGVEDLSLPYVEGIRTDRDPYTDTTLARAIREGRNAEDKPLHYMMPRYTLNDTEMSALIAYLQHLDQRKSPGVSETELHFATIITPEADPVKVGGMLDVLEHYFAVKNTFPIGATPRLRSSRKMMFMANRQWQLHVWRLSGPAASWQRQLEQFMAKEPVLAVVSGLGGTNWAPVQAFCEHEGVPCLFPNVDAPPADADRDFYSLYFSKGVLLEAGLIANRILEADSGKVAKVVRQIYRAGDSGEPAAQALAASLQQHGIKVRNRALAHGAVGQDVAEALHEAATGDALVLWLRPADLAALDTVAAAPATVYMSGLMSGLERTPLPPGWRERTLLAYPFDLPERRRVNVDFARGWFAIRHIPVVDEQVQTDTYLACGLLAEALSHMADTFVRDYLVERIQSMLEHRIVTGYYPRLALASGQRFASKGGYMVRFASDTGWGIIPASEWIRP
ncbi:MAG: c-type cytochrome [Methylophilaceae bacterium]